MLCRFTALQRVGKKGPPSFQLIFPNSDIKPLLISVDLADTWALVVPYVRASTISAKKPDNVSAFVTVSLRVS